MRNFINIVEAKTVKKKFSFINELGNKITARVTNFNDDRDEPIKMELVGPDSTMEDNITAKEAKTLADLITSALTESVYYRGEITPEYSHPIEIVVLKNPSLREVNKMFATAKVEYGSAGKELRAFLTATDLYVWDAGLASHDAIKKAFQLSGMHLYIFEGFMKMDDYLLRDEDMKRDAIAEIEANPAIVKLYGEVKFVVDDVRGSCFVAG